MSCADDETKEKEPVKEKVVKPVNKRFGYVLDDYEVVSDTVQSGDSFGQILFENGISLGSPSNKSITFLKTSLSTVKKECGPMSKT